MEPEIAFLEASNITVDTVSQVDKRRFLNFHRAVAVAAEFRV